MSKKKYRVLKAIALDGVRRQGEIIEISEDIARNIGSEYLEEIPNKAVSASEPATAGEAKVEEEKAVKPDIAKKKNKNLSRIHFGKKKGK